MDLAVLADLERREVEPERRDLPAQLGDLAPGDPRAGRRRRARPGSRRARRRARRRRRSGRTAARPRRSAPTRVRRSRSAMNPKRWRYGSSGKRRRSWRSVSGSSSASRARRVASGRGDAGRRGRRRRHGLHQPQRDRLVAVQDVVGLDAQRPLGRLGGDDRVAVAVAADPRPEAEERRHARRPLAGPDGPAAPASSAASTARYSRGHEREQRRVEDGHRRADLVERLGRDGAQVGGPPQQRDLLAQAAADLAVLGGRQPRVVEPLEQDARSGAGRRASCAGAPRSGGR